MKNKLILISLLLSIIVFGCKKPDPQLGDPPTVADAEFTYQYSAENNNIIEFTASNQEVICKWDFGNETKGEGPSVRGLYPFKGIYTVTLTIFSSGGSISTSQDVVIENDDPTLLDIPIYNTLTGGAAIGTKTWVIDSVSDGHMGVGPNPVGPAGEIPEWWAANGCDKKGTGLYNDKYTFSLIGFKFDMITNGYVYLDSEQASKFPGSWENLGDHSAPYPDQLGENWSVTEVDGESYLNISGDAFLGFYTGVNSYKIISHNENELKLRYLDSKNGDLMWYITLVPENVVSGTCDGAGGGGGGGGGGSTDTDTAKYDLPIGFEQTDINISSFGGAEDTIIDNPDTTAFNPSSKVLQVEDGVETWAGVFTDIKTPLDFSTKTSIAVKIWAPGPGTLRIKLEDSNDNSVFVEKDVSFTKTNEWEEVLIDFTGEPSNLYDRIVLFPGWGFSNAGTFYLDDIIQK